jgi:hypothetical protein
MKYFQSEWIDSTNKGWYEGVADCKPSTDNALEYTYAKIKKFHTLGERLAVNTYLENAMNMMMHWS